MNAQFKFSGSWMYSLPGMISPWYNNLVLDSGIEEITSHLGSNPFWNDPVTNILFNKIQVGDGTSYPSRSDTELESPLYEQEIDPIFCEEPSVSGNSVSLILGTQFSLGSSYRISEFGLKGDSLFSRVTIPPVTVLANERLVVYYKLTITATSGSGVLEHLDPQEQLTTTTVSWCFPTQSLLNGLSRPFFNLDRTIYYDSSQNISVNAISNLPNTLATGVGVSPISNGFRLSMSVPVPADIGAIQVGGISDMLSTFFSFNPIIDKSSNVESFDIDFNFVLGE